MIDTVRAFNALREEFVEVSLRHDPVAATAAGIHDYDAAFPDDSPDGYRERARWLRDLDQRLVASVPWDELPTPDRVDYAILRSRIALLRAEAEEIRPQRRNPVLFPETALRGIFLLLARPFAPLEERKEPILARMMGVPEYLEGAQANLEQVPEEFRGIASEVNSGGLVFVDEVVRTLARHFPGEAERIEHAGERARVGFLRYQEFVDRDLRARAGGSFALGERWMNFRIEREHLLSMDCAYLDQYGREQMAAAKGALADEARRIDPLRPWQELIAEAKERHPEPLRVRDAYVAEMERARAFVAERRLAPIAAGRLDIVDTPPFERVIIPVSSYLPPAPFDVEQTGHFFVTPVDLARRAEIVREQVRSHNHSFITLAAVHEAYPGRHLQLCHAAHRGSRLRKLTANPLLAKGWAMYCEQLMDEQGFFTDPHTRLYRLAVQLWRACRVVIDVGLHTGRMTTAEAAAFLVEHALLEPSSAETEVHRYALTPTEPMSYLVGKMLIEELRAEAERAMGRRFTLHDFHAALLESGTIPPFLVREELWGRLGVTPA
uniref:DUF885 domain-containing protein n=1 Tax=Eiseniibacteriota bacterium TaxID=2212470 RepID=A0A832I0N6_UNCEI